MNEHVIAEIAIRPVGTQSTEISSYVRGCIDIVRKAKDIKYELSSMGTNIDGYLLRLVVKGTYGKNWIKWVNCIEIE